MIVSNNRVILVDYKFGEKKEEIHLRQIEQYASLIREMGYQNTTGYLWYITRNEIEKKYF
jgi:CRISPR/Cas system-associated exonuclease Cas4 (RecB family)